MLNWEEVAKSVKRKKDEGSIDIRLLFISDVRRNGGKRMKTQQFVFVSVSPH